MLSFIWWPASWHDCVWCARTMCFQQTWKIAKKLRIFQYFDFFHDSHGIKFKDSRTTRLPWEVHNMMDILLKSFWCTKDYLKFHYPMKALEGYFPNLHNTTLFESAWNWPTLGSRGHEEVDQARAQRPLRTSERSYWPHTGTIWAKFTLRGLWAMSIVKVLDGCVLWLHSNFKTENTLSLNL